MDNVQQAIKQFNGLSAEQTKRKILQSQDSNVDEEEETSSHGNTGLPFGLCKKHGIALPDNATPRDAWDALKGIGIYPPWTDKGKGQYSSTGDSKVTGEEISEQKQKLYNSINEKLSKFPQDYREKLSQALSNLTDDEIAIIAETIGNARFEKGSGSFSLWGNTVTIPAGVGTVLDRELGYDFQATTFFHEYGHYLAYAIVSKDGNRPQYRDFNEYPEMQAILREDAQALLERVVKEMGIEGIPSLNRIKQEYKYAFRDYLNKLTEKAIAHASEPIAPKKPTYDREEFISKQIRWWGYTREKAEQVVDDAIKRNEESYQEDLERYHKKLEWYNSIKDQVKQAQAKHQRYGFISDFIAGATHARINPMNYGHWGHADSYWTGSRSGYVQLPGMANGVETWAEYVAMKMTKDQKGLDAFKDYLPRTHAKYEEIYSKLKGDITGWTMK